MPLDPDIQKQIDAIPPAEPAHSTRVDQLSHEDLQYDTGADPIKDINEGGYAVVFRATLPEIDEPVAVKRPPPGRTTRTDAWRKITDEARLVDEVDDHEYIVNVLDWGEDPFPWIAMEFLEGGTLGDRIDGMGTDQRLWTAFAVVDAVTTVNAEGVGHFDITPPNILFAETAPRYWDQPKLADWGESRQVLEEGGDRITAEYAAPEMLSEGERVDLQADVYQAGLVCYETITGVLPDHHQGDIPKPSHIVDVPEALDEPILRALAHDRGERYEHTLLFRQDLYDIVVDVLAEGADGSADTWSSPRRSGKTASGGTAEAGGADGTRTTPRESTSVDPRTTDASPHEGSWPIYRADRRRSGHTTRTAPVAGVEERWQFREAGAVESAPAVIDDKVVFGTSERSVLAVRSDTGAALWEATTNGDVVSSPAVAGGTVFVGCRDNDVYAFGADSGRGTWTYTTDFWVSSSPLVVDGVVYIGSQDYSLYAIDADAGTIVWQFRTDAEIVDSSPAFEDGRIIVGSTDGNVYAVDADTGAELWRFETEFSMETTPAVVDGTVYVGSSQNRLYALDSSDGTLEWTADTKDSVRAAPAVADGTIVFGSDDGHVYALDSDGGERWRFPTEKRVRGAPVVASKTVYVGNDDGNVYGLDLESGRPQWRHNVGAPVTGSLALANGFVYVATKEGLFALEATET